MDDMEAEQDSDNSKFMQDCVLEAFDQLKPATPLSDQTFNLLLPTTPTQCSVSWGEETHPAVPLLSGHTS